MTALPINRPARKPLYSMRALGRDDLPRTVTLDGTTYRHARTIKHDFWAVTGFYESGDAAHDQRVVVVKLSRTTPFAGVPLRWVGRWLCRREARFYERLIDVPNVPALLGFVGDTGFVHAYVPGQPLSKEHPVPDRFFAALQALIAELHRRDIAYVDAHKPQNILLGDDGRPHLIDFQISWDLHNLGDWFWNRWLLRRFQQDDLYHILKHKRRLRPDEMTQEEWTRATKLTWTVRLHRIATRPYFIVRRALFRRLREKGLLLPEGSK